MLHYLCISVHWLQSSVNHLFAYCWAANGFRKDFPLHSALEVQRWSFCFLATCCPPLVFISHCCKEAADIRIDQKEGISRGHFTAHGFLFLLPRLGLIILTIFVQSKMRNNKCRTENVKTLSAVSSLKDIWRRLCLILVSDVTSDECSGRLRAKTKCRFASINVSYSFSASVPSASSSSLLPPHSSELFSLFSSLFFLSLGLHTCLLLLVAFLSAASITPAVRLIPFSHVFSHFYFLFSSFHNPHLFYFIFTTVYLI